MKSISLVVVTANSYRHKYFANQLIEHFDVRGVVSEVKRPLKEGETKEENEIVEAHSREREESEQHYFGEHATFNVLPEQILNVQYGEANSPKVFEWISKLTPDYIALFGTGIIKNPLLCAFENRIINMHLGLSPYYRGSGTNFWPLVYGEPELIGVTIHLATARVDAGSILGQVRPVIEADDNVHDIGHKTIIAGVEALPRCIRGFDSKEVIPRAQNINIGKVIKHKDFSAEAVVTMKKNVANGMIADYVKNKDARLRAYPIIEITSAA